MAMFECRHEEWHDDNDWHEVKAYDAPAAAHAYAEHLDSEDSEAFTDPEITQPILVRESGRPESMTRFVISFDYCKSFRARRERAPTSQPAT